MFSRISAFLNRHRRKIVVSGFVIGGALLLSRCVRKALQDWQEKQTKLFLEQTRKQQHYESVERICNQTALTLITYLKGSVERSCSTETLISKLQIGDCDKFAVWEDLKYRAFSKIALFVYSSSLLMVTLRLQVNLIGGYMFKSTMGENNSEIISSDLQEKYLSENQNLLTEGMAKLYQLVREKTEFVLRERSLKEKLTFQNMEQIFWAIHAAVSNDHRNPCQNLPSYILPTVEASSQGPHCQTYQKIMAETGDLLESDEIRSLTSSSVSRGFAYFVEHVAEFFIDRSPNALEEASPKSGISASPDPFFAANINKDVQNLQINYVSIPMAKVIPILNGLVRNLESKSDVPYTWMQQLILMDNLKTLGANIYESFSV